MSEEGENSQTDFALCWRLLQHARPFWSRIALVTIFSLFATPLALLTPIPLKLAVDCVIDDAPLPFWLDPMVPDIISQSAGALLVLTAILSVSIAVLTKVQGMSAYILSSYTSDKLVRALRTRLFRHAQRLSLAYHDTRGTSDSIFRIQNDTPAVSKVAIGGVIPLITSTTTVVAMLYVSLRIDWQLALFALLVTPLLIITFALYRKHIRKSSHEVLRLNSSAFSVIQEVLGAVRVVKAFGQEDREEERYVDWAEKGIRARLRYTLIESSFSLIVGTIMACGTASILFLGVKHVQGGIISLGDLLLMMAYLAQLYAPLKMISSQAGTLQSNLAQADRVFDLLDETQDVPEKPGARPLVRASGDVDFRGVSFAYTADRPVLKDISVRVPPGSRVGIAGPTGAGKTTLASLLTRFYDPDGGSILLDGVDLRDYKLADLRDQFSIVLQEPVLFSTTILENIAYSRPDAKVHEIEEAAKMANVHDFILSLPDGYDTSVGERGMKLSGGERQRISLARAFLKDAPILILDEPTSSVDLKTESTIVEALERLMAGRTTFIIAHRLSTLDNCDVRLHIEEGRLHDETKAFSAPPASEPAHVTR